MLLASWIMLDACYFLNPFCLVVSTCIPSVVFFRCWFSSDVVSNSSWTLQFHNLYKTILFFKSIFISMISLLVQPCTLLKNFISEAYNFHYIIQDKLLYISAHTVIVFIYIYIYIYIFVVLSFILKRFCYCVTCFFCNFLFYSICFCLFWSLFRNLVIQSGRLFYQWNIYKPYIMILW